MINPTTSTHRAVPAEPIAAKVPAVIRPPTSPSDQLSTENAAHLRAALERQPEIRPEVVERARTLAADPSYPSLDILKHVSAVILKTPDLSDAQS